MRLWRSRTAGIGNQVFLLPAVIVLLAIVGFPLLFSIVASFFDLRLVNLKFTDFTGFRNYLAAFSDRNFLVSLWNTVLFVLVVVSLELVVGMLLALWPPRRYPQSRCCGSVFCCRRSWLRSW